MSWLRRPPQCSSECFESWRLRSQACVGVCDWCALCWQHCFVLHALVACIIFVCARTVRDARRYRRSLVRRGLLCWFVLCVRLLVRSFPSFLPSFLSSPGKVRRRPATVWGATGVGSVAAPARANAKVTTASRWPSTRRTAAAAAHWPKHRHSRHGCHWGKTAFAAERVEGTCVPRRLACLAGSVC